jgi:hypothetical protein
LRKILVVLLLACACAAPRAERFRNHGPSSLRLDPDQADAIESASLKHSWATMFRWWAIGSGVATLYVLASPAYEGRREAVLLPLLNLGLHLGISLVLDGSARSDIDRAMLVPLRSTGRARGDLAPARTEAIEPTRSRRVDTPDGRIFLCMGTGEAWTCREEGNPDAPPLSCTFGPQGQMSCVER